MRANKGQNVFYSIENGHNVRQIRILSVGSLVSKPPTKEKRISLKVRMPLSGTINMGAPEWLDNIFIFVSKNHDMVTPDIEFKGYSIGFNADNLFGAEGFNGQECTMKGFQIFECGDSENPDVVMEFSIRMPFLSKRWDWLGASALARIDPGMLVKSDPPSCCRHRWCRCSLGRQDDQSAGFGARQPVPEGTLGRYQLLFPSSKGLTRLWRG